MRLSVASLLLAVGCTMNAPTIPEGWPKLDERVHVVSSEEVHQMCRGGGRACARVRFCDRTCDVWIAEDDPDVFVHEHEHCQGRDHWFESTMRDGLARAMKICPDDLR